MQGREEDSPAMHHFIDVCRDPTTLQSLNYWGKNERSFIMIDAAEFIDETLHTKNILLWWHWLLILVSILIAIFYLFNMNS